MDASPFDGVWRRLADSYEQAVFSPKRWKHVFDDFITCPELQHGVQIGGAHGPIRQCVWLSLLWAKEQLVVRWQMALDHDVHALGKTCPVALQMLSPRQRLGYHQQTTRLPWQFVYEMNVHQFFCLRLQSRPSLLSMWF